MKYTGSLLTFIVTFVLLSSCNVSSDDAPEFVQTTIRGKVMDTERDITYAGDSISLAAIYSCGSGFNSGVCYELIAKTVSDSNGDYEFIFDYDTSKGYQVDRSSNFTYYEDNEDAFVVEAGADNIINFVGWRPVIFKVDATIINNVFPDVTAWTRDDDNFDFGYDFPYIKISEENTSRILYLHGKPNTQMSVGFYYNDDGTSNNYHEYRDILNTQVQDTIALTYIVDCSQF